MWPTGVEESVDEGESHGLKDLASLTPTHLLHLHQLRHLWERGEGGRREGRWRREGRRTLTDSCMKEGGREERGGEGGAEEVL